MNSDVRSFITGHDNYLHVIVSRNQVVAVDPGEAAPLATLLSDHSLQLTAILLTHHHSDHTAAAPRLKTATGCSIIAPADSRLRKIDRKLHDGEEMEVAGLKIKCLVLPGHTRSGAAFYLPEEECVFTGDTLFSAGCGRLFESTPGEMYQSLQRLCSLPPQTAVYCGHEYTAENLRFALTVEPDNRDAADLLGKVLDSGRGVPTTIDLEKRINPFLRTSSPAIRTSLGMVDAGDVQVFAELRARKDRF